MNFYIATYMYSKTEFLRYAYSLALVCSISYIYRLNGAKAQWRKGTTAQRHNGSIAQATFAKATVAKGRKGTMAHWHIGKKFLN